MLVAFTACEKDEEVVEETPANIPGMGAAAGELQVDPFNIETEFEGIEIVGAIEGVSPDASPIANELKSTSAAQSRNCYGSGHDVRVRVTLKNTSSKRRTVWLPRGLVFKVNKANYQHAMLMQWTWICIQAGETRTFDLNLYCINKGDLGSDSSAEFSILGITNSKVMWRLLRMIGWRKINLEHYEQVADKSALKAETALSYETIVDNIQEAVWDLTNRSGLDSEREEFIMSIPMLEDGTYPTTLDDKTVDLPEWWNEYIPAN
ncbi:hypothetical protein [Carboxylicivirga sp. N1Y90]|uniref:hypothetical protein n=1 Tax=Carboxylicivirga fragile TaxID=3417571 RepID=UPI003D334E5A|nr:hypothetical protein [Marinilabiliaceae bacterium N1Y90]